MELRDKRVLITGGTRGIGRAIAIDLARHGAHIAINSRQEDNAAKSTMDEILASDRQCHFIKADVGCGEECATLVQAAAEALGGLDVLINNAGGPAGGRIEDIDATHWNDAFAVHVHSCFYLCQAALPLLKQNEEAAILLMSSVAAIRGCPGAIAYGTVKAAVLHFTRMLARDVADDNIRVNCLCPGIIRTRFHEAMTDQQQAHNLANRIPLHREGTADQVAEAARLLITNDFMTGESVTIDGGMAMQVAR